MSVLFLFDIDDTLLTVDSSKIRLYKGSEMIRLSTEEFRDWRSQGKTEGYTASFEEFNEPDLAIPAMENATPAPGFDILKDILAEESDITVGILTARSSEEFVVYEGINAFFKKQGVSLDIDPSLVFAVNNPKYKWKNKNDSEKKLSIILLLLKEDIFDHIFLVDDDPMHKKIIDEYCERRSISSIDVISI